MLHGVEQVALVIKIDQMADDFGIRLADERVAATLQFSAQRFVVFDDAVVDDGDAMRGGGVVALAWSGCTARRARPRREMRVCVVHGGCAVRGPAGVGNASAALNTVLRNAGVELSHPCGAAGTAQCTSLVDGDAAGIVATVFEPAQAFDQDWNDVARRDRADDAAHSKPLV